MSGFYDDASWVLIPEGIKEDIVYAQKPTDGLGDLTFTRASDATRTNSAGVIERTPWNLLQFSEMFADAYWTKSGTTISANVAIAPDGNLTADKLIPVVPSGQKILLRQNVFVADGQTRSWSIYVKGDGYRYVVLGEASIIDNSLIFDTTTGTYTQGSINQYFTSILTPVSAGNGWWRIGYSTNLNSAFYDNFNVFVTNSPTGTAASFAGNGTSGILVWGAQLVEGTDAKPYFATTNRQDVPRLDYRNADGTLNSCPRLLLEPQRTNSIRNSTMVGAVAGSPGTIPTNWGGGSGGLTRTVVGLGTENGLSYIDVRYNGTANSIVATFSFETNSAITAAQNQVWANSVWVKNIATPAAANQVLLTDYEFNSVGTYLVEGSANIGTSITTTLKRFEFIRTLANVNTTRVQPLLQFILTNGATYDFTIRIAAPQMELGATASTFIPTTTTAVTRVGEDANRTGASAIIGQTEGTVFYDVIYSGSSTSTSIMSVRGLTKSLNVSLSSNLIRLVVNGVSDALLASPNTSLGVKMAIAYNNTGVVLFANGVQINLPNTGAEIVNDLDVLQFRSITQLNSLLINQAALFKTRLTNAQLAEITTL
jgi:hypothetical protein